MHPDLIPGLPVKTYGFCMALGFLAAWQVLSWLSRRTGRQPEPLSNLLMLMLFSGIVGARLEYVREFWGDEFAADPLSVFKVWQGGLVFYGGLILAIAVFVVWCRMRRERMAPVADLFVAVIPSRMRSGGWGASSSAAATAAARSARAPWRSRAIRLPGRRS